MEGGLLDREWLVFLRDTIMPKNGRSLHSTRQNTGRRSAFCSRALPRSGVQVPPLAPIFISGDCSAALVGCVRHRVARALVAGLLVAVTFRDVVYAGADRGRVLRIGAARFGLQFYDVAIDVVTGNRAASRAASRHD